VFQTYKAYITPGHLGWDLVTQEINKLSSVMSQQDANSKLFTIIDADSAGVSKPMLHQKVMRKDGNKVTNPEIADDLYSNGKKTSKMNRMTYVNSD